MAVHLRTRRSTPENEQPKPYGSESPEKRCPQKIGLWLELPKPGAQEGATGDHAVADQIIGAIRASSQCRKGFRNNQSFAGRLAKLLKPAHDKRQSQPFETAP